MMGVSIVCYKVDLNFQNVWMWFASAACDFYHRTKDITDVLLEAFYHLCLKSFFIIIEIVLLFLFN